MKLDKIIINKALDLLAEKINENDLTCRICIYDDEAMLHIGGIRNKTNDVDFRVLNIKRLNKEYDFEESEIQTLRRLINEVAEELNLNSDWMNDGVKGFISENEDFSEEISYGDGILSVVYPSIEYLLAMKCVSMRNLNDSIHDREDIKNLLNILEINDCNKVYDIIELYYPVALIQPKTMYGIEEIVEKIKLENQLEDQITPSM
ncbi:MAG: hypothetical protein IJU40_02385 [Desulfovibrionaceae bacterium]|nr:hypothetical protein [Desulfovibrionaceae bacterium]